VSVWYDAIYVIVPALLGKVCSLTPPCVPQISFFESFHLKSTFVRLKRSLISGYTMKVRTYANSLIHNRYSQDLLRFTRRNKPATATKVAHVLAFLAKPA